MKYKYLQDFYLLYTSFFKVPEYFPVMTNRKKYTDRNILPFKRGY